MTTSKARLSVMRTEGRAHLSKLGLILEDQNSQSNSLHDFQSTRTNHFQRGNAIILWDEWDNPRFVANSLATYLPRPLQLQVDQRSVSLSYPTLCCSLPVPVLHILVSIPSPSAWEPLQVLVTSCLLSLHQFDAEG